MVTLQHYCQDHWSHSYSVSSGCCGEHHYLITFLHTKRSRPQAAQSFQGELEYEIRVSIPSRFERNINPFILLHYNKCVASPHAVAAMCPFGPTHIIRLLFYRSFTSHTLHLVFTFDEIMAVRQRWKPTVLDNHITRYEISES